MKMRASLILLLSLIFSYQASADVSCQVPTSTLTCKGTFKAQTPADVDAYKTNLGLNNKGTHIRNLKIEFDYTADSIELVSPCRVIVAEGKKLTATNGGICIRSPKSFQIKICHLKQLGILRFNLILRTFI